jgi:hypothetical protein
MLAAGLYSIRMGLAAASQSNTKQEPTTGIQIWKIQILLIAEYLNKCSEQLFEEMMTMLQLSVGVQ